MKEDPMGSTQFNTGGLIRVEFKSLLIPFLPIEYNVLETIRTALIMSKIAFGDLERFGKMKFPKLSRSEIDIEIPSDEIFIRAVFKLRNAQLMEYRRKNKSDPIPRFDREYYSLEELEKSKK